MSNFVIRGFCAMTSTTTILAMLTHMKAAPTSAMLSLFILLDKIRRIRAAISQTFE